MKTYPFETKLRVFSFILLSSFFTSCSDSSSDNQAWTNPQVRSVASTQSSVSNNLASSTSGVLKCSISFSEGLSTTTVGATKVYGISLTTSGADLPTNAKQLWTVNYASATVTNTQCTGTLSSNDKAVNNHLWVFQNSGAAANLVNGQSIAISASNICSSIATYGPVYPGTYTFKLSVIPNTTGTTTSVCDSNTLTITLGAN